ncbi:glycosyltransferase family 2 protein, partial [Polyporus arcularius HHB13444]
VPSEVLLECSSSEESTHLLYTRAKCGPDEFAVSFEPRHHDRSRPPELCIAMTMYNKDRARLCQSMQGVVENIEHFRHQLDGESSTQRTDSWKEVVVCIVSDGRDNINKDTLKVLTKLGVYSEVRHRSGICMIGETGQPMYQYDKLEIMKTPIQVIFCLKEKNQKKINSHRWFFNVFARQLEAKVCILLDVGTVPCHGSFYHLWKAFNDNPNVGGACGEIVATGKHMNWKDLLNPLVAAQNFEYKMSNILDKPMESAFGYITVLPGAFSAYRYEAVEGTPLDMYFKGESLPHQSGGGDIFARNMYLAEDRVLCWEVVSKRDRSWILHYVKSARAETDVPHELPEFIGQRRRWLNGSFFAAIYTITKFGQICKSDHCFVRKSALLVQFLYLCLSTVFSWFALGNYFIVFLYVTESLATLHGDTHWLRIFITNMQHAYIVTLIISFVLSLGNRPKAATWEYTVVVVSFTLETILMTVAVIILVDASFKGNQASIMKPLARNIVISVASTLGLYTSSSLIFWDFKHMITSFIPYLCMTSTYISVLNVYAVRANGDISWGTKGDD